MRKLLLTICLLLIALPCQAQMLQGCVAGSGAAATSCTGTTNQIESLDVSGEVNFASLNATLYRATEIVYAGTTGTLCRIDLNLNCTTSDCTQVLTAHLYADSGSDEIGSLISTCSGTYNTESLETSDTYISFTGCSGTVTNGTKYWVTFSASGYNTTDYIKFSTDLTCTTEKIGYGATDSGLTYSTGACGVIKMFIME